MYVIREYHLCLYYGRSLPSDPFNIYDRLKALLMGALGWPEAGFERVRMLVRVLKSYSAFFTLLILFL